MTIDAASVSCIGLDQGSSSTKAVVLSGEGGVIAEHSWPVRTIVTDEGVVELVEHEPEEILDSVQAAISWGIVESREAGCRVHGIGVAVQRSGVLAWDTRGRDVSRVLSWRDGRTRERCEGLLANADTVAMIARRSGLLPNPFFAASKWALMQSMFPDPSCRVGTLDSYILARLLRNDRFITDDSMAARTLLYDLEERRWCPELCGVWGVEEKRLPQIIPSVADRGVVREGIPVLASLGDKEAAAMYLLSQGEEIPPRAERAVLDLGTLATLTIACETVPTAVPGIGRGVLCSFGGRKGERLIRYEQEIRSSIVGDVLDWLSARLGKRLSFEELAQYWATGSQHNGVIYSAARTGSFGDALGGRGEITCDGVGDAVAGLVRAALEHIIFSLRDVIDTARSVGMLTARAELVVSGGLAHVEGVGQFLANSAQIPLMVRHPGASASALGAASLALRSALGKSRESARRWTCTEGDRRVEPSPGGMTGPVAGRYVRWRALRDAAASQS